MSSNVTISREEFASLARLHQGSVRAFVRSLGAHADSVDDIAQEAFLAAWKLIERFDPTKDFGAWVRGIARNILLNEKRRFGRRTRILSERLTEILSTNYDEADEDEILLHHANMVEALRECMTALAEKHIRLLRSRYGIGRRIGPLADALGTNANALSQMLMWIRAKLRVCIESKLSENMS